MLPLLLSLCLVPAQPAEPRTSMLVLDVAGDAEAAERRRLAELLSALLVERVAIEVITQTSVRDRFELEAAKQEAGCNTESCLVEIANALGAKFVVFSRLTRVGESILKVEIYDAASARGAAQVVARAGSVEGIASQLPKLVDALLDQAGDAIERREKQAAALVVEKPFLSKPGALLTTVGVGALGVAVLAFALPAGVGAVGNSAADRATAAGEDFQRNPDYETAVEAARAHDDAVGAAELRDGIAVWSNTLGVIALVMGVLALTTGVPALLAGEDG